MMKILVMGATRGVGERVVERALLDGHEVRVLVRDASRFSKRHPRLEVMVGDALDSDRVLEAMEGRDAVISALGAPARSREGVRESAARVTVESMKRAGVARLVVLSTLGLGESRNGLPWFLKYLIIPLYLRRVFADHEGQESAIRSSKVDWTIVRPPTLTNDEGGAELVHSEEVVGPGIAFDVSRADVARFMLDQLEHDSYVRKVAAVSRRAA